MTRGQLPQRAGSLGLNGGGAATAVPPILTQMFEIFAAFDAAYLGIPLAEISYNSAVCSQIYAQKRRGSASCSPPCSKLVHIFAVIQLL